MRIGLVGAGARGYTYSKYIQDVLGYEIVAVADINKERLAQASKIFGVPEAFCFSDGLDLINSPVQVDAVIIATLDKDHYVQTMAALDRGWDILLEKPISPDAKECLDICAKAEAKGCGVTVCHVLRYTPFFVKLKEIIDSNTIGKIVAVDHTENVGNHHIAHSFVRGNWRISAETSPIIMAKSCHDLDILLWLTGSSAARISSFGSLSYFKAENAPEGSADRCLDCSIADSCRFDVRKAYLSTMGGWPAAVLTLDQTEEGLMKAFRDGPYGRCVFKCDNDVCDHQSTIIEFENGVTATFTLSGMTNRITRLIHVMCEDGEIHGDSEKGEILITRFRANGYESYQQEIINIGTVIGGHSGGDVKLLQDFAVNLTNKATSDSRSSISKSIESHLMACAAEESRVTGKTICMAEYRARFV